MSGTDENGLWETELKPRLELLEKLTGETAAKALQAAAGPADLREAIGRINARMDELEQASALRNSETAAKVMTGNDPDFAKWLRTGDARAAKVLSEDSGSTGAVLAPHEFVRNVTMLLHDTVQIRQYATTYTTSQAAMDIPRMGDLAVVNDTNDSSDYSPGSTPATALDTVVLFGSHLVVPIGRKLANDALVDVEGIVQQAAASAYGRYEDRVSMVGNGATEGEGIFTNASVVSGAIETVDAALAAGDIIALYHSVADVYARNGVWLLSRTYLQSIRAMRESTDGPFLWDRSYGLNQGDPPTILGRPYVVSENLPALSSTTTGDLFMAFGDLRAGVAVADSSDVLVQRNTFSSHGSRIDVDIARRFGCVVTQPAAIRALKVGS